jgi:hypothetical protein
MLDSFALSRSVEDVLAGRLRVTLGGEVRDLPVRSIASNRRWVENLDTNMAGLLAAVAAAGDDSGDVARAMMGIGAEDLLSLVIDYDETHVLPPREVLEEMVSPSEALIAVMTIRRVQNPLADAGLAALSTVIAGRRSQEPTSSPPRNGASTRRRRSTKG